MNAPSAFDTFLLYGNEPKVVMEKDTKVRNAALFHVNKEDHTLGNMIRVQLLKDPKVLFAGYKVAHPLEHKFTLRIQTQSDYTPIDALINAINDLHSEISLLKERFAEAIETAD
jgi:DNA-directed RNA polymerase II subunit RPB11